LLRKINCWLVGHMYETVRQYDRVRRRVRCDSCGKEWYVGWFEGQEAWISWDDDCARFVNAMQEMRKTTTASSGSAVEGECNG
jgi:hypothetical protein